MKIKKVIILLLVLFIPFFCYAEECNKNDIKIESIELSDIRGNAEELSSPNNNNNKINLNTKMNVIGDNITYKVVVKNTSNSDYTFDKNMLSKDYLSYDITYEDDSNIIKPNEEKVIYLRLSYDSKPEIENLVNGVLKGNEQISFDLTKETEFINPETGNKILLSLIYLLIPVITFFYLIKKKKPTFMLLLLITIIPYIVNASCTCVTTLDINLSLEIDRKEAIFLPGKEVNIKMKQLAGDDTSTATNGYNFQDQNITAIKKGEAEPIDSSKEEKNVVSTPESLYPIYMWYEDNTIYWWSEDETPALNENASAMFFYMKNLINISSLEHIDSSNTTNMIGLFARATSLPSIEILEKWNTSNVIDMSQGFAYIPLLTSLKGVENWDVSNVINMASVFYHDEELNDISAIKNWNVKKVVNMAGLFSSCHNLEEIDLSNWETKSLERMDNMFAMWDSNGYATDKGKLKRIIISDKFSTDKVTSMYQLLANVDELEDYSFLKFFNTSSVKYMLAFFQNNKSFSDEALEYIKDFNVSNVIDFSFMFFGTNITTLDPLKYWNTEKVENTNNMFCFARQLKNLNGLENWDVSNVTNMNGMFYGDTLLSNVSAINDWDISNVTDFGEMMKGVPVKPSFTKVPGTWNSSGTFIPS